MSFTLAPLPAEWSETAGFKAADKYSTPTKRPIEPVGRFFLAHASRTVRGHTWSEFEKIEASKNVKQIETSEDDDLEDEEQSEELLSHDPRNWKTADLYAVLGLSNLRYKATEEQVRKAHRKQVLKHHPDKKAERGGLDQDGFFKIIQKAFELMLDSNKRQQYDSVDEGANVHLPATKAKYEFFEAFGPVFESEARFSKKQPVPTLGDINTPKPDVDAFYAFWGSFDSWRSFEFLDEDVPDDTSNRDHKRYIEKKNAAARKKKKTEDNRRIIELVERALAEDPRIKLFKENAKKEKERKKWEREAGSRKAAEEAAAQKEAEEKAKKEAEESAKSSKDSAKKAKEAAKNAKKKNKRTIRGSVKDVEYFGEADKSAAIEGDVDLLLEKFDDLQLSEVAAKVGVKDAEAVKTAFNDVVKQMVSGGNLAAGVMKYFG